MPKLVDNYMINKMILLLFGIKTAPGYSYFDICPRFRH